MYEDIRRDMVKNQIERRGVSDPKVLRAVEKVPRHLFVPPGYMEYSYSDRPLPIGDGQTISQPYIVAYMTEVLEIKKWHRVLEIGTGSGYQTAVLAELSYRVYTVEIIEELQEKAKVVLDGLGYKNIEYVVGDGYEGYEQEAPYDRIILTAAPKEIPEKLLQQLAFGGKIVLPVGASYYQELVLIEKNRLGEIQIIPLMAVSFVPMVKQYQI